MKPLNYIKNIYPLLQSNSFPFLEKTFDDIDEYAILARIQRAINEVITNNNTLNDNFTELNNYVTDYFKNLDVQDEIDQKLQQMANDGTLTTLLLNYTNVTKVYNTYSDFINDKDNLSNNQKIKILGYYTVGDGGESDYYITDIANDNYINLENGLYAQLIFTNEINVAQFGAKGNDTDDDTEAIQKAINFMTNGMTLNFIHNKVYKINKTLNTYRNININGNGAFLKCYNNFPSNNYMINFGKLGTAPSNTDTYARGYGISNLNLIHFEHEIVLNGIMINNDCTIKNIYSWGLDITINCTSNYIDKITIDNVEIWGKIGENYAISLGYIGDGRVIKNIHNYSPQNGAEYNTLLINGNFNCCDVSTIINGNIKISGYANVNIKDLHLEAGNITISNSIVNLSNAYIWKHDVFIKRTSM